LFFIFDIQNNQVPFVLIQIVELFNFQIVRKAGDHISIMPGNGINFSNAKHLAEVKCSKEMQLSARAFVPGKMNFQTTSGNHGWKRFFTRL